MKFTYDQLKKFLPELSLSNEDLADRLSVIGFETKSDPNGTFDLTLLGSRKDCADLEKLAFDFAAIEDMGFVADKLVVKPGRKIIVTLDQINKLLGTELTHESYKTLERLGFVVESEYVVAPEFRQDIKEIADVAEEVVRVVGFSKINISPLSKQKGERSLLYEDIFTIKKSLADFGFTETLTSSFAETGKVKLKNPFTSDEPFLRETLLVGLLKTLARNPYLKKAAFFEIGDVFLPDEQTSLGLISAGSKDYANLSNQLSDNFGAIISLEPVEQSLCQKHNVKQSKIFYAEIPLSKLNVPADLYAEQVKLPKFKQLSKFPPLVLDKTVEVPISKTDNRYGSENSKIVNDLEKEFGTELLFVENIDFYVDKQHFVVKLTFRLLFQKFGASFTEPEIGAINKRLQEYSF